MNHHQTTIKFSIQLPFLITKKYSKNHRSNRLMLFCKTAPSAQEPNSMKSAQRRVLEKSGCCLNFSCPGKRGWEAWRPQGHVWSGALHVMALRWFVMFVSHRNYRDISTIKPSWRYKPTWLTMGHHLAGNHTYESIMFSPKTGGFLKICFWNLPRGNAGKRRLILDKW